MKPYRNLFFDLDRTIWDFDRNSYETLHELYQDLEIQTKTKTEFEIFFKKYTEINHLLWDLYRSEKISKEYLSIERFSLTLKHFGANDVWLAEEYAKSYLSVLPQKTLLFDGVIETLEKLKNTYRMHIITNGFQEVQYKKLTNSRIDKYFDCIITSENANSKKPESKIFLYALQEAGANSNNSIMIGDDIDVDIQGAKEVGMDQIFCNFDNTQAKAEATFTISSFLQLQEILIRTG